jgi:hypothetical protein
MAFSIFHLSGSGFFPECGLSNPRERTFAASRAPLPFAARAAETRHPLLLLLKSRFLAGEKVRMNGKKFA